MQEVDIHKLAGHHTNMVELLDVMEQPDCVSFGTDILRWWATVQ